MLGLCQKGCGTSLRTRGHIVSVIEARRILGPSFDLCSDEDITLLISRLDQLAKTLVLSSKESDTMHSYKSEGSSK